MNGLLKTDEWLQSNGWRLIIRGRIVLIGECDDSGCKDIMH